MNNLDKKFLYIFFENHKRKKASLVVTIFGWWTSKHAEFIKRTNNFSTPIVTHVGFLFFKDEWVIAELDYFQGGKIKRKLTDKELLNLHLSQLLEINNQHLQEFDVLFSDDLLAKNWFYSFRRYSFENCKKLLNSSNSSLLKHRIPLLIVALLQNLAFKEIGYNCVDLVFEFCKKHEIKIWDNKKTPYELLNEL